MGFLGQIIASKVSGQEGAARDAANIQAQANDRAIEEQRRQYDQTRADQAPWLQTGKGALSQLASSAGIGTNGEAIAPDNKAFTVSPGYQFRLSEGQRDLGNSFAARGGAFSGNALKALSQYNQESASNEYGNWWNRMAGLAGVGQASANTLAGVGQNTSNSIGNFLVNGADARASGILTAAAIRKQAINQGMQNDAQNFGYFFGGGFRK